jgi:hypothetical protein
MFFAVWGGFQAQKRRRATTVQDAGALAGDHRTARSVVDCASSGALGGRETISAERELSQLAAGGMTRDGWDDFDAAVSGDALRIGTIRAPVEPFSLGNGLRRDAEYGNRDIALPSQDPMGGRAPWWPSAKTRPKAVWIGRTGQWAFEFSATDETQMEHGFFQARQGWHICSIARHKRTKLRQERHRWEWGGICRPRRG